MPIGKNAIKRVDNNGYSKVQTSAPDMEHSVIAKPDEQVVEKLIAPVEQATAEKVAEKMEKKAPAKTAAKKTPAKKPAAKKAPVQESKEGFARVSVGEKMPYYLL